MKIWSGAHLAQGWEEANKVPARQSSGQDCSVAVVRQRGSQSVVVIRKCLSR